MTGSTGIAALSLEGATIHSQSGLQRGKGLASELLGRMSHACKKRWQQVQCIVIDEISMISAHFLDLLDEVARVLKGNTVVFGNVRMVFVGDFGQLAPVADLIRRENGDNINLVKQQVKYAFQSPFWHKADLQLFRLNHCWRCDVLLRSF